MRRNRRCAISATDYLLKVFDYKAQSGTFEEAPLETRSIASEFSRMRRSSATSRRGCLIAGILASWIAAQFLVPKEVPRPQRDCRDPGWICRL